MAKSEWGTKRHCQGCGAHYYDLRRDPPVCPKCDAVFVIKPVVRPRRPLPAGPREVASPIVAPKSASDKVAVADVADDDTAIDVLVDEDQVKTDETVDELDADADDDSLIEDASDLGEDEDDMSEVKEHMADDDVSDRSL
ncbi:MAG: TIGR02300 family protein [Rhodospirillales bacterium]|nr:TIGR02300 family protein [Rhodospirillales bacterium]